MIANALRNHHQGQTLLHEKRRYCIDRVDHFESYVRVHHNPVRGRTELILPLRAEVEVTL